jgi:hypothetical protein
MLAAGRRERTRGAQLLDFVADPRAEPDAAREPVERDAERELPERGGTRPPPDLVPLRLLERLDVLDGVTAARALSNSFSAALFAFCASRRTAVSALERSRYAPCAWRTEFLPSAWTASLVSPSSFSMRCCARSSSRRVGPDFVLDLDDERPVERLADLRGAVFLAGGMTISL